MSENRQARQTKIEKIIERYNLVELEKILISRWTDDEGDRWSLRDLADYVNKRVLEAALLEAGKDPLDGEIENYHRLLTDDRISAGNRSEAQSQLRHTGLDIDQLQSDFVSHQAVHTYLTERKKVAYEGTSPEERRDRVQNSIQRLKSKTEVVSENSLSELSNADIVEIGDFSVLASINVDCEDCGTRYELINLIEQGGCGCQQ